MIRVAFIIDSIESPTAGTEKQLLMLIRHLDRTRFAPVLFVLRTSDWLKNEFNLCPLEVINFRSFFRLSSYREFFRFVRMLRQQRFDCLQTHFVEANILGIIAAKMAGTPFVISSRRDQGYWHTPGKLLLYRLLNRWVDVFVANCHATSQWASDSEGIAPESIRVIYNGAELEQFSTSSPAEKQTIRSILGISEDAVIVGIVANLRPVKRVDVFLRAAALVSRSLPGARFVVVGDGEQRQEFESLAAQLGISDSVVFLGKRTDIPFVLKAVDIAVLSSDSESFSNSIVEYMASGLPVVATDVGGCREMIVNQNNGYIVPPADPEAMAGRILDIATRLDLAQIGKNNSLKAQSLFSCESMVAAFGRLYAERQRV